MMEEGGTDTNKTKNSPPTSESMESRGTRPKDEPPQPEQEVNTGGGGGGGGGWGGWGFSSVLSDLQKAAEEISRNAAVAAEKAAKSIADMNLAEDSESSKGEDEGDEAASDKQTEEETDELRKSALDKLEKASDESVLGQGLKDLDHSVENFATGAWQALGNAWKSSSSFVQRLENSAVNLAETIQKDGIQGAAGSVAPNLLESGKAFTTKGMQVLEYVGKETMDLLITETGMDIEKNSKGPGKEGEDQLLEDVTFDRCFYIYGGPEHLEELEALSSHYALLFNRRKAKLSSEQKSVFDGQLKMVQQTLDLGIEMDGNGTESNKGKKVETGTKGSSSDEMKTLHDSSVSKAADMAAGFTNALAGQSANDMIQRTSGRLDALHSEGIHRLSDITCSAVSQLLMLGKSIISHANKHPKEDADENVIKVDWPEDSVDRAKLIREKAQTMAGYVEAVSNSFITGIADVAEAYLAAIKGTTTAADSREDLPKKSIEEKAKTFAQLLRSDHITAVGKIRDGLQYLSYVIISTSMPAAAA
ncbi:unnamed protein product [Linum trigynum]|uniref:DUF7798 domain-containing protein n=1 Tax=Linum trigynum TaxID=586398 RepID=A0AAV2DH06_9ROSI